MSRANELTNNIIDFIYRQGGYAWKSTSTGVFDQRRGIFRTAAKKGVADILACRNGRFIAIEIKIGKDRLSPEQEGFLKNIEYAGGLWFVAKDIDSFKEWWYDEVI